MPQFTDIPGPIPADGNAGPGGTAPAPDPEARHALRKALLARRATLPGRAEADARLEAALAELLDRLTIHCLGFYWPIQQEFDARAAMTRWLAASPLRSAALPSVSRPGAPLDFHRWAPGAPMREGRYGIPVPADAAAATPDALLIPCVGFSAGKFRLGYGGGFYDRTLAALAQGPARPLAIGIGYEACRVALAAEPHDVPMDWMVTETGAF
ncbi:5-formyltetrahydrofolate cyclo-ligase [Cupriavidus respiraculi]|uniref:5-formyltetrahydrofolate cyclo-ligase n=1 Tax=Cupriavidus respiraculi TaxID=195930 RepID=UPI001C956A36|nr:5-formyltetrahydrofolate cyclo-ligase [Cupriavidus respiraculi]MBY4946253.1 5-formyltetrahydrofolate cyclo-ligase [Cupriavidus respiraculi]